MGLVATPSIVPAMLVAMARFTYSSTLTTEIPASLNDDVDVMGMLEVGEMLGLTVGLMLGELLGLLDGDVLGLCEGENLS